MFKRVPDNYEFCIDADQTEFPKGSQLYLCYGRMTNRQTLQRYGFCLTSNKYNNVYIKLRLESSDEDFAYRQFIIQKFYSVDCLKRSGNDSMDVTSRHFNVHYQKFNSSKFSHPLPLPLSFL